MADIINTCFTDDKLVSEDIHRWLQECVTQLHAHRELLDAMDLASGLDNYTGTSAYVTMRHACDSFQSLPSHHDIGWTLDNVADAVIRCAHGIIGVLLAEFFSQLYASPPHSTAALTAVECASMLKAATTCADKALLPSVYERDPDTIRIVMDWVNSEMADPFYDDDAYRVVGRAWSAAQEAFVESAENNHMRGDARAAVFVMVIGALADTLALRCNIASRVLVATSCMLRDMRTRPLPHDKRGRHDIPFLVRYTYESSHHEAQHLRNSLIERGIYGAMSGRADLLGVGIWQVVVRTREPHTVLPAGIRTAVISNPCPVALRLPAEHDNTVIMLERPYLRDHAEPQPLPLIAVTRAPGLVEDLANSHATVFFEPTPREEMRQQPVLSDKLHTALSTSLRALIDWIPAPFVCVVTCDKFSENTARTIAETPYLPDSDNALFPSHISRRTFVLAARNEWEVSHFVRDCAQVRTPPSYDPDEMTEVIKDVFADVKRDYTTFELNDQQLLEIPDHDHVEVLLSASDTTVEATRIVALLEGRPSNRPIDMKRGGQSGPTLISTTRRYGWL
ncbi:MAG: hypothetical protein Q4P66_01990 [Actinomycetaceae bacterium]|nr:hypothetical protein [Actinomycetaceae bacterium]